MRLEGASAEIRQAFPEEYVDLAVFVTDFGSVTAIMLILSVLYWVTDRRRSAVVASYAVIGAGFILLIKTVLAMPRPPEEVFLISLEDDPYGFPSGHAFMAVVVYGGLLVVFDRLQDLRAATGILALILAISLSRVVLGLHYLGDIVVGAALGVVFLVFAAIAIDDDPRRGFVIAALVAIPAVVVSGGEPYALVALGAAIGGSLASTQLESIPPLRSRVEGAFLSVGGLGYLIGVSTLESILVAGNPIGLVLVNAVLVAGVLLAPLAVDRVGVPQ